MGHWNVDDGEGWHWTMISTAPSKDGDAGSELGFSASSLYKKSPSLLGPQFPLLYNEDLEMIWKGLFHTEPSSSGQFSSVAQ